MCLSLNLKFSREDEEAADALDAPGQDLDHEHRARRAGDERDGEPVGQRLGRAAHRRQARCAAATGRFGVLVVAAWPGAMRRRRSPGWPEPFRLRAAGY